MKKLLISLTLLFLVFFIGFNGADAASITLDQIAGKVKTGSLVKYYNQFEGYVPVVSNTDNELNIKVIYNGQGEALDGMDSNLDITFTYNNGILSYEKKETESASNAFGASLWFTDIIDSVISLYGYDLNYYGFDKQFGDTEILETATLEKDGIYLAAATTTDGTITYPTKLQLNVNDFKMTNSFVQRIDSTTNVGLYSTTKVLDKNIVLSVKKIEETNAEYKKILNTINSKYKDSNTKLTIYDINLLKDNSKVQPNGDVILNFEIPNGYKYNQMAVFRVEDNGNLTKMPHELVNGKIKISTNHFSNYVLMEANYEINMDVIECPTEDEYEEPTTPTPSPKEETTVENPETGIGFGYGIIGLIILLGSASYVYMRKYNKFPKMR